MLTSNLFTNFRNNLKKKEVIQKNEPSSVGHESLNSESESINNDTVNNIDLQLKTTTPTNGIASQNTDTTASSIEFETSLYDISNDGITSDLTWEITTDGLLFSNEVVKPTTETVETTTVPDNITKFASVHAPNVKTYKGKLKLEFS